MAWEAWGKLTRDGDGNVTGALDLVSHCLDVAAVTQALLNLPGIRRRMERLGERTLTHRDVERLLVLAFLHDIGKSSLGFQSKRFEGDERRAWLGSVNLHECGHTHAIGPLFTDDVLSRRLLESFPVLAIDAWHPNRNFDLWLAAISHHGVPINAEQLTPVLRGVWKASDHYDPFATLRKLGEFAQSTWPDAFVEDNCPLPAASAFVHAYAGMVSLADWIGSENHPQAFPYDLAPVERRWTVAARRAGDVLRHKRIELVTQQEALRARQPAFGDVFRDQLTRQPLQPSSLQAEMADPSLGQIVVVEAETGSGKTEAALWRFKTLFEAGEVDSLAFVLPTRVSAVQIEHRVNEFIRELFPHAESRPNVVLAVPGYLRVDGEDGIKKLPGFEVQWPDSSDEQHAHLRWAAENAKRYLAASCAVGTIDQVLLAGLPVRHAHLRGFSLLRSLLVVDEVHASDRYMVRLLDQVLRRHRQAGGHALLLSATLGVAARDQLLRVSKADCFDDAHAREACPYPAVTDAAGSRAVPSSGRPKYVRVELRPWVDDADSIALYASQAVVAGARVLIVRNTVGGVIAVQRAVESILGAGHPALFRYRGVVCPHHGRFAALDRRVLDEAVNVAFGKHSPSGARVLCGSQTLEQSLDIDCDLLITDLAPIDVLLQRVGRLHRHQRDRPEGFADALVVVMTPSNRDLSTVLGAHSGRHGIGGKIYENVVSIEATWRELEQRERLNIPADNRKLVERCTDPDQLLALAESSGETWLEHWERVEGRERARAGEAALQALDWNVEWNETVFPNSAEERARTRLGVGAIRVRFSIPAKSPFGQQLEEIAIPAWMMGDVNDFPVAGFETVPAQCPDGIGFVVDGVAFDYGRAGLQRGGA